MISHVRRYETLFTSLLQQAKQKQWYLLLVDGRKVGERKSERLRSHPDPGWLSSLFLATNLLRSHNHHHACCCYLHLNGWDTIELVTLLLHPPRSDAVLSHREPPSPRGRRMKSSLRFYLFAMTVDYLVQYRFKGELRDCIAEKREVSPMAIAFLVGWYSSLLVDRVAAVRSQLWIWFLSFWMVEQVTASSHVIGK